MTVPCNIFSLVIRRDKRQRGSKTSVRWFEELQVDSVPLTPRHCLDYVDLVKSMCLDGEYFFFTCGCDTPACSGIHTGVNIRHEGGLIHWHSTEPGPERNFIFAGRQYRRAIWESLREAGKMITGGNEFPLGTMSLTRERFRRLVTAAELAWQLDQPGVPYGKIHHQFVEIAQNVRRTV